MNQRTFLTTPDKSCHKQFHGNLHMPTETQRICMPICNKKKKKKSYLKLSVSTPPPPLYLSPFPLCLSPSPPSLSPTPFLSVDGPGVSDAEVHEVGVACSVHGGHQHLSDLLRLDFCSTNQIIPVSPVSASFLL